MRTLRLRLHLQGGRRGRWGGGGGARGGSSPRGASIPFPRQHSAPWDFLRENRKTVYVWSVAGFGRRRAGGKARLQERVSPQPRRPAFGRCHPMKVAWHLRAACCADSGVDRRGERGRVLPSAPSQ